MFAMNDAINIFFKYPLGIGNHQIKIDAANINRNPINKTGGKDSNAGFAITKPKPKKIGTSDATRVSLKFIQFI